MKAFIRHIGLVDHQDRVHSVSFGPGVNVITGRSSTGKSALIEIFDYCFGSSEFTVPEGVITEHGVLYFVVMQVKGTNLVIARTPSGDTSRMAFLCEEFDEAIAADPKAFSISYFGKDNFLPIDVFKKELGKRFGLTFTDVDEDLETRRWRRQKAATPSIRSFSSFMLQHQNLVANKYAIFYRFDEKEKRDQAIEHFKIFMGYVTPEYFQLVQELREWERDLRNLESQLPRAEELNIQAVNKVKLALAEFSAISGTSLVVDEANALVKDPGQGLQKVREATVKLNSLSDDYLRQREGLERDRSKLIAVRREEQRKLQLIKSSIEDVNRYVQQAESVPVPTEEAFRASHCPFCNTYHPTIEKEANKLEDAISWLNEELQKSSYIPASLAEEEKMVSKSIADNAKAIEEVEHRIEVIDKQVQDLARQRSQFELAVKAKVQVESALEQVMEDKAANIKRQIKKFQSQIKERKEILKRDFNVESKLHLAEGFMQEAMREIGAKFEFEESFQPINLRFSFETFDLWHEMRKGNEIKRVPLRSMGSGANWLYCHLTLFLALHRYFCGLGDACHIPSILFLDQPSQVYFPTILDTASQYDPKSIAEHDKTRSRPVDDDIKAVNNMFSQLVEFCGKTKQSTQIDPQIIVTDHADNLTLSGGTEFKSLVRANWRPPGSGLVHL